MMADYENRTPVFEIAGPNFLVVHRPGTRHPRNAAEMLVMDAYVMLREWGVQNPLRFLLWAVKRAGVWPVVCFIAGDVWRGHKRGQIANPGAYVRACLNRAATVERLKQRYGDIPRRYMRPALRWMRTRWQRLSERFKEAWARAWGNRGWEYLRARGIDTDGILAMVLSKFIHPLDCPGDAALSP